MIKALYQLRLNYPYLKFRETIIVERILDEANDYVNMMTFLYSQAKTNSILAPKDSIQSNNAEVKKAREVLIQALQERIDNNLKRIFRLLGLKYPPEDIENAYIGIKSSKPEIRINVVEFLDNLLEMNLKRSIIPIVETAIVNSILECPVETLGLKIKSDPFLFIIILRAI